MKGEPRPGGAAEGQEVSSGYRLQMALVDLIDFALQAQHLRWNVHDTDQIRRRLDDFEALARASADVIATRMRDIGVPPDGRVHTAAHDLLFAPLDAGPIDQPQAVEDFVERLLQMGSRLQTSRSILAQSDPRSADVLASITSEISTWLQEVGIAPS